MKGKVTDFLHDRGMKIKILPIPFSPVKLAKVQMFGDTSCYQDCVETLLCAPAGRQIGTI